jgi:hypothetical protein
MQGQERASNEHICESSRRARGRPWLGTDHSHDSGFSDCHLDGRRPGASKCFWPGDKPGYRFLAMPAHSHRGSAPVEFVLVSSLLVAVVLALIQLSVVVHVRHTLIASAQEGARWASYYDTQLAEGAALTRRLISEGLSPRYAEGVAVGPGNVSGQPGVRVIVTAPLPMVGLWSGGGSLRVWADAPLERPKN